MAYTLSNKRAKKTDSSTSTYHQKRGHMLFLEHSVDGKATEHIYIVHLM